MAKVNKNKNLIVLGFEILIILSFAVISFMAVQASAYYDEKGIYWSSKEEALSYKKIILNYITPGSIENITEKTAIKLTGKDFTRESVVRIDGVARNTTFVDSEHLITYLYPNEMPVDSIGFLVNVYDRKIDKYSNSKTLTIGNYAGYMASRNSSINLYDQNQNTLTYNLNSTRISSENTNDAYSKTISTITSKIKEGTEKSKIDQALENTTANAIFGSSANFMPSGALQWMFVIVLVLAIIVLWRYIHRLDEKYQNAPLKHA